MTDPFSSDGRKAPPKPFTATEGARRSVFVLRQAGRRPAARFDELWPRFGLAYAGTGAMRDSTPRSCAAPAHPRDRLRQWRGAAVFGAAGSRRDHVGIEVHAPGVGRLLNALDADGATNVKLYHHDAVEVLGTRSPMAAWTGAHLLPDPLAQEAAPQAAAGEPGVRGAAGCKLAPGGRLHLATDWQDYAEQMWDVLDATRASPTNAGPRGSAPPRLAAETHFEARGLRRLGHGVWDLLYDRC